MLQTDNHSRNPSNLCLCALGIRDCKQIVIRLRPPLSLLHYITWTTHLCPSRLPGYTGDAEDSEDLDQSRRGHYLLTELRPAIPSPRDATGGRPGVLQLWLVIREFELNKEKAVRYVGTNSQDGTRYFDNQLPKEKGNKQKGERKKAHMAKRLWDCAGK